MSESALDRLLGRAEPPLAGTLSVESETTEDNGCFGWLRGVRERALMLELRKRTGQIKAFGYAWLECAEFDPSDGIILHFPGHLVRIKGRHLNHPVTETLPIGLYGAFLRHRVPWIQESEGLSLLAPNGRIPMIETINWDG